MRLVAMQMQEEFWLYFNRIAIHALKHFSTILQPLSIKQMMSLSLRCMPLARSRFRESAQHILQRKWREATSFLTLRKLLSE